MATPVSTAAEDMMRRHDVDERGVKSSNHRWSLLQTRAATTRVVSREFTVVPTMRRDSSGVIRRTRQQPYAR
jgi:hypothetical protein